MRETNFDPEFSQIPLDMDESEMMLRMSTEIRQSYYYESTIQSRNCTESSFYLNNPHDIKNGEDEGGKGLNVQVFNNFFSSPGNEVNDIYNDSSGSNKLSSHSNSLI